MFFCFFPLAHPTTSGLHLNMEQIVSVSQTVLNTASLVPVDGTETILFKINEERERRTVLIASVSASIFGLLLIIALVTSVLGYRYSR